MTSVQQATLNALADWLTLQLAPAGVVVEPRFPAPSKQLPARAVTLTFAGPRKDEPIVPRILAYVNSGSTQTIGRYQIRACEQPIQVDIWAKTDPERDDILARLDIALTAGFNAVSGSFNPDPVWSNLAVKLSGDWSDTYASFQFGSVENTDTADGPERAEYRSTIRGVAHVMLAVTKQTARQIAIKFSEQIDASIDKDIWTLTATGETHSTG